MTNSHIKHSESLKIFRLIMVISSLSPLFILWAIQGIELIPHIYTIVFCLLIVIGPYVLINQRKRWAKKHQVTRSFVVGKYEDHRSHLLAYLLSILLPFYRQEITEIPDLLAVIVALLFIIFIFWHLNLHYMNLMFAIRGYRTYTIHQMTSDNYYSDPIILLISRRKFFDSREQIEALRLSHSVYLEE